VYFLFYPWLYEVFEVVQIKQQKMKKKKGKDNEWKKEKERLTVSLVKCIDVFSGDPTESNCA